MEPDCLAGIYLGSDVYHLYRGESGGAGGCSELGKRLGSCCSPGQPWKEFLGCRPQQWYPDVQCLLISVVQILPLQLISSHPRSHWTHKTPEDLNVAQPFGHKEEPRLRGRAAQEPTVVQLGCVVRRCGNVCLLLSPGSWVPCDREGHPEGHSATQPVSAITRPGEHRGADQVPS